MKVANKIRISNFLHLFFPFEKFVFDACLNTFWIREGSRFLVIKKLVHVKISSETTGSFHRPLVPYSKLWKSKNIKHSTSSDKKTGWQGNLKFYGKSNFSASFIVCWIRAAISTYLSFLQPFFSITIFKREILFHARKIANENLLKTINLNLDLELYYFLPVPRVKCNFVSSLSLYRDKLHIIMIQNDPELLSLRFFALIY